jgi:hypothetical protein
MNKRHYYCMLGKPAPAQYIPVLIERAEQQGWDSEHVMFCGVVPVSSLDIKQQTATPVYTIIFSKWGERDKAPALPNMEFKSGTSLGVLPDAAAPDDVMDGRR